MTESKKTPKPGDYYTAWDKEQSSLRHLLNKSPLIGHPFNPNAKVSTAKIKVHGIDLEVAAMLAAVDADETLSALSFDIQYASKGKITQRIHLETEKDFKFHIEIIYNTLEFKCERNIIATIQNENTSGLRSDDYAKELIKKIRDDIFNEGFVLHENWKIVGFHSYYYDKNGNMTDKMYICFRLGKGIENVCKNITIARRALNVLNENV